MGRETVGLLFGKKTILGQRRFQIAGGAMLGFTTHCAFFLTRSPVLQEPFWILLFIYCIGGAALGGVIGFLFMISDDL